MSEKLENELINQRDSNGERTGLWKDCYWSNRNLWSEGNFVDGKKTGLWKYYYINGNLQWEGNFVDGKDTGLWKYYNREGQLNKLISYV